MFGTVVTSPHETLVSHVREPGFRSSFLITCVLGSSSDGPGVWVAAFHVEDPDWFPVSGVWAVSQWNGGFPISMLSASQAKSIQNFQDKFILMQKLQKFLHMKASKS